MSNYQKIIKDRLKEAFERSHKDLEQSIPAMRSGEEFHFRAFGRECIVRPDSVILDGSFETGPMGVIISLYVAHVNQEVAVIEPFCSFRDMPGSMPYHGPFKINTEARLVPYVEKIKEAVDEIISRFGGEMYSDGMGDFAFILYPLPKIALLYSFYLPDDEFPASVSCMFSANANIFVPVDGLADVGEYTSGEIIRLVT
jgi:hypothetical protein